MPDDKKPNISSTLVTQAYKAMKALGATAQFTGNFIAHQTGFSFLENRKEDSIEKFHSPNAQAKILQEYGPSVKTTFLLAPLKDAIQAIHTNLGGLERLLPPEFNYEQRLNKLQELLEQEDLDNPRVIAAYVNDQYQMMMNDLTQAGQNAIDAETKEAFTTARDNLKIAFEKGKAAHKEGDKEIPAEMSLQERFKRTIAQAEQDLVNLVWFSEINPDLPLPQQGLEMHVGPTQHDPKKYRTIQFKDYQNGRQLYTPAGLQLTNHEGSIIVTIPSFGWSPFHHHSDNKLADTFLFIVNQIKAEGKESITWTININDPELRQKVMEEAYYAAKLAGFSDDQIIFEVSAKPTEGDKDAAIDHKTAKEIGGKLGNVQHKIDSKLKTWQEQQQKLDQDSHANLRTGVDKLEQQIEELLTPPMHVRGLRA